jgi:hypothetical protein
MTPKVALTGTGRHGSGWIAKVLNRIGVTCGHEDWWNPWPDDKTNGFTVDSSWLYLASGDKAPVVWWQVRHPLDVVSSLAKQPLHEPYRAWALRLMPWDPWDPIEWAMLACLTHMDAAHTQATRRWRLEDVSGELVVELARDLGVYRVDAKAAQAVVDATPPSNWHGEGPRLSWPQLPKGGLRDQLMAWAEHWGYE